MNDISNVISELGTSFTEFKAAQNDRISVIEKHFEDEAVMAASRQMQGTPAAPASKFQAHYSKKADYSVYGKDDITMADFMSGVAGMKTTEAVRAALSTGSDVGGGYAVPSKLMPTILDAMVAQSSVMNAGAKVELIDTKSATFCAVDSVPVAAWRAESGDVIETDPIFRGLLSTPTSLSFIIRLSRELQADALDIDRAIRVAIAQGIGLAIDKAALIGSGVGVVPLGLAGTAGVHQITNGTNGASLAGFGKVFEGVQAIIGSDNPAPTALICSPRELVKFGGMVDTTGQPLQTPAMLQGVSRYATSQLPVNITTGTSTDTARMFLGAFENLTLVMREQLFIAKMDQVFAKTGEIAYVVHCRVGVVVNRPKAFAVISGIRA